MNAAAPTKAPTQAPMTVLMAIGEEDAEALSSELVGSAGASVVVVIAGIVEGARVVFGRMSVVTGGVVEVAPVSSFKSVADASADGSTVTAVLEIPAAVGASGGAS